MKGILSNTGGSPDFRMPRRSESKCLSSIRCMTRVCKVQKLGIQKKVKNEFFLFFLEFRFFELKINHISTSKIWKLKWRVFQKPHHKIQDFQLVNHIFEVDSIETPWLPTPDSSELWRGFWNTHDFVDVKFQPQVWLIYRPNFFGCEVQILTDVLEYARFWDTTSQNISAVNHQL